MRTLLRSSLAIVACALTASAAFADESSPCNDQGEFAPAPHKYYETAEQNVEFPIRASFIGDLQASTRAATQSTLSAH